MSRWIRLWLCCLVAFTLPLQAVAHEGLRACHGRQAPPVTPASEAPADAVHGWHARHSGLAGQADPADLADHAAHHGDQGQQGQQGDQSRDGDAAVVMQGSADPIGVPTPGLSTSLSADAACVLCAGCGVASALPPSDGGAVPGATVLQTWSAAPAARIERVAARGPERPPRAPAL